MDFSYIICYRHQPERYVNLLKTIDFLKANFDFELILVEQDTETRIPDTSLFDNYIFSYSDKHFNRSWAFNVGSVQAKTDKLYFGDCDLICPVKQLNESIEILETKGCVSPYGKVVDLHPNECRIDKIQEDKLQEWESINRSGRSGTNLTGGIVGFRKDDFLKIGGWCEDFEGWGGEDDFLTWKVKNWITWEEMKGDVYHLWHVRPKIDQTAYKKNLGILQSLSQRNPQDIVNWINQSKSMIGNKDKLVKKDIETNEDEFIEYLKGKTVAIVGPAPSIIGSNQRELIESYDIIIRLNKAVPVPKERIEDVGHRTNIYYHCMSELQQNGGPINFSYLSKNIDFISSPYPYISPFDKDIDAFNDKNRGKLKFHIINKELFESISKEMNTRPNTGICAIIDILNYDIKELYVTGFTFFRGGYDKTYRDQTEDQVLNLINQYKVHEIEPQIKYMKNLFDKDNRLKGDEKLLEILNN